MVADVRARPAPILVARDLAKSFGALQAVNGVSLEIGEGEILGLLGPNGAGKTTTISMLATQLRPDAGSVRIGGVDALGAPAAVRSMIGLVPQEVAVYQAISARENVAFFAAMYGMRGQEARRRVEEVLEIVGLAERAGDRVETYSGGMKRRVNLAAGLVHRPRLLFLDEPTVGVDPQSRNHIFESVRALNRDGMAVLYTTHYMEEAQALCDRVAIMDRGEVIVMDTPKALIAGHGTGLLQIALEGAGPDAGEALLSLPGVQRVAGQGPEKGALAVDGVETLARFELATADAQRALLGVIGLADDHGWRLASVEILESNLESVFLSLTGKRLRD